MNVSFYRLRRTGTQRRELESPGLGGAFLAEAQRCCDGILEYPEAGQIALHVWAMTPAQSHAAAYYLIVTLLYGAPLVAAAVYTTSVRGLDSTEKEGVLHFAAQTLAAIAMVAGIVMLASPVKTDFIYFQF